MQCGGAAFTADKTGEEEVTYLSNAGAVVLAASVNEL